MAMKVDMSALETNFGNSTFPAGDDTYFSAGAPDVPSMVLPTCDDVSTPSPPSPLFPYSLISFGKGVRDLPDSFVLNLGCPLVSRAVRRVPGGHQEYGEE